MDINQIWKIFFPKTSLEGLTTWSKMVKIDAAAEWQWREALILIRLLFHLILIVFQSYGLKRKHVAKEGQHGEGHEGGDQDQEMSTKDF